METQDTKKCNTCKEEKQLIYFTKNVTTKDGLRRECKSCERHFNLYKRKIENKLLATAKYRAKKKNLEFNLSLEDIKIPEVCPVLGIKLKKNTGGRLPSDYSPSVDRIDNEKGYTKDNIRIISFRANTIKGYATKEELKKVIKYFDKKNKQVSLLQNIKNVLTKAREAMKTILFFLK